MSRSPSPDLALAPDTLAALQDFLSERQQKQEEFERLVASVDKQRGEKLSVEQFTKLYGEDWQASQFWYAPAFAYALARSIRKLCVDVSTKVAFLSCPTAYVAFKYLYPDMQNVRLLEYDKRFDTFAGGEYCHWNLHDPTHNLPVDFTSQTDIAIVDPPFLNKQTNEYVAQALRRLMRLDGKLILLTSTSLVSILPEVYNAAPLGPLNETSIKVQHNSGIANAFAVWTSWKGGEGWQLEELSKESDSGRKSVTNAV